MFSKLRLNSYRNFPFTEDIKLNMRPNYRFKCLCPLDMNNIAETTSRGDTGD